MLKASSKAPRGAPAPGAPDRDEEGVRARVLSAGRAEFARRGFEAAGVRSIADAAGVTPAMINYYFRSKRALYDAVVEEAQGRLAERVARGLAEATRGGLAARLAGAYFDFLAEERELQRILLFELFDGGEAVAALGARYVAPLRAVLREHFGDDPEATQLAISLFGAVAGYFVYEPVVGAFLGEEPLSSRALDRRRRHVVRLAQLMEENLR